ncbi:MAG: hypothetical protein R3E04_04220, partial [Sphingobium sp.]
NAVPTAATDFCSSGKVAMYRTYANGSDTTHAWFCVGTNHFGPSVEYNEADGSLFDIGVRCASTPGKDVFAACGPASNMYSYNARPSTPSYTGTAGGYDIGRPVYTETAWATDEQKTASFDFFGTFSTGLCDVGSATNMAYDSVNRRWTWDCEFGANPSDNCTSFIQVPLVIPPFGDGSCGSANGSNRLTMPESDKTHNVLCIQGIAQNMTGTGPWAWDCVGASSTASCTANKLVGTTVDGECNPYAMDFAGTSAWATPPTEYLCLKGNPANVTDSMGDGNSWNWTCQGTGTPVGLDKACSGHRVPTPPMPETCTPGSFFEIVDGDIIWSDLSTTPNWLPYPMTMSGLTGTFPYDHRVVIAPSATNSWDAGFGVKAVSANRLECQ